MRRLFPALLALAALTACDRAPALETRTFPLQHIKPNTAEGLIMPYVFSDRAAAPGVMSTTENTVTVRETADNLEKIARVLAEYDVPSPWVRLHFQLIEADGAAARDSAIADVEAELRNLFRFAGYRLLAEAVVTGAAHSHVEQVIGTSGGRREPTYLLGVGIGDVRTIGDSGFVSLDVQLRSPMTGALATQINARAGQTVVLGNAQLQQDGGTVILVVRPELVTQ
jgi:hypothetical protein